MTVAGWVDSAQWFFLAYFVLINAVYLVLNAISLTTLRGYGEQREALRLRRTYAGAELPVSILVPAYNEERTIVATVQSLLQLEYLEFEVIVINDGSSDKSLAELIREFELIPYPAALRVQLATQPVRTVYRSVRFPHLRVLDKENGGKADALNAGINAARYPVFCAIDADSILERDSLWRAVEPFLDHPDTIAAGGTVRIANGCMVESGFLTKIGLPRNPLALFQIVEYLRAFLFGRVGWSAINAVLVISGAFGVFRRDAVVAAGGYSTRTLGEDMELIVRLHRIHRLSRTPYRIVFVPEPICWTEAPVTLKGLRNQRIRWQRGLGESLFMNGKLLFHPRGGAPGWFAMPFTIIFEWFSPAVEVGGYAFMLVGASVGVVSIRVFLVFLLIAFSFGLLLSISSLLLEEVSARVYPNFRQVTVLMLYAVLENLGFRQLVSCYRVVGLWKWLTKGRAEWGKVTRTAQWRKDDAV